MYRLLTGYEMDRSLNLKKTEKNIFEVMTRFIPTYAKVTGEANSILSYLVLWSCHARTTPSRARNSFAESVCLRISAFDLSPSFSVLENY